MGVTSLKGYCISFGFLNRHKNGNGGSVRNTQRDYSIEM